MSKNLECPCTKTKGLCKIKTCIDNNLLNPVIEKYYNDNFKEEANTFEEKINKIIEHSKYDYESCWLKSDEFINYANKQNSNITKEYVNKYVEENFLPLGPRDMKSDGKWPWLSNVDIDKSLNVIQKCFKNPHHMQFHMIDFEDPDVHTNQELATTDFGALLDEKGEVQAFTVINTDKSSGSGIHWFAVYLNLSKNGGTLEHFNSSGRAPRNEITTYLTKLKNKLEKKYPGKKFNIVYNRTQHQSKDSECGVYSVFYIWARLTGIPFERFNQKPVKDENMERFRKRLFRVC